MKKFIRHFVSFFLVAVMIVSSNITAFAANEKPVDSRFLPEITYTEDNTSTTRVPNLIPITVNPYYNKLVVHVGNLGVDSIDSVAFQTLSSRQLNNRGFSLIILKEEALQQLQTSSSITHFVKNYNSIVSIIAFKESAEFLSFTASSPFRLIGISDSTPSAPTMTGMLNETPSMP